MQQKAVFLAYFFICVNCFAQQYPFVYYTPKDGLINSRVRNIKQDSNGRMLFITYGGLSIYDGTRFINYSQQNGLANDLVNDIIEITPDSFLVATNTQKINTLVRGKVGELQTEGNFCPVVNRFFKSYNGDWYAAADEGLFEFRNKKFTRLSLNKHEKDLGTCLDRITEWKNFLLIVPWNTELPQKLILYNKSTRAVDDIVTDQRIFSVDLDSKNLVLANTSDGVKEIDQANLQKGKITFVSAPALYSYLKNRSFSIDGSGNTWFFSSNELQRITYGVKKEFFSTEQGLKAGTLTCIFQDKENIIWMGTDGNGVVKLKSTNIQQFNSLETGKQMVATAICQAKDTTWVFNEHENCIYRVTGTETKKFSLNKKLTVIKMYAYRERLYLVEQNEIKMVGNRNSEASYLHPTLFFKDTSLIIGNGIIDRQGTITCVILKNEKHFLVTIKQNKVTIQHSLSALVDQIALDKNGLAWLATRNDYIMAFSCQPFNDAHYLQLAESFEKLPPMGARCLTFDKNNDLWIGTRYNGLYQFSSMNHQLNLKNHFTTKDGLTDNFIYTLACDSSNNIWVGTQTGLDKIFKRNQSFIVANIGKNNNNFQIVTCIEIANDGTVWSENKDGTILKILPENTPQQNITPTLLLTSIKVNNEDWNRTENNFSYKQNSFSFTVAAPSFIDEKSIHYQYSLQGSDNNHWSEASNLATFSFFNLSPGSYTLHVRCDFPESMYPSQEISYSFLIKNPWWKSWWFFLAMAIFIAGLLTLSIRNYYRGKLQKQKLALEKKQAIEKERTRIATDMHDDLGAGLSRIKFLSETIGIKKQQQQPIEEDVIKIREYSHEMIGKMGEIVWALNEKNDSLSDLIVYTRAYAMEYLSENGIGCKVNVASMPENIFVSGEFRRNIFLSAKEALHNIVKHAQANNVFIKIEVNKELEITIRDDGIGFNNLKVRPFSNGISNIEKRMREINGTSQITGIDGTTVVLKTPLS